MNFDLCRKSWSTQKDPIFEKSFYICEDVSLFPSCACKSSISSRKISFYALLYCKCQRESQHLSWSARCGGLKEIAMQVLYLGRALLSRSLARLSKSIDIDTIRGPNLLSPSHFFLEGRPGLAKSTKRGHEREPRRRKCDNFLKNRACSLHREHHDRPHPFIFHWS